MPQDLSAPVFTENCLLLDTFFDLISLEQGSFEDSSFTLRTFYSRPLIEALLLGCLGPLSSEQFWRE